MRTLLRDSLLVLVLPLSGCDIGPASLPWSSSPDAATTPRACRFDSECGTDAVCVLDAGAPRCAPLTAEQRAQRCAASCRAYVCGEVVTEACGRVSCGTCSELQQCNGDRTACEYNPSAGPQWSVRVESAQVTNCATTWDRCDTQTPACTPTLPDPYVIFGDRTTGRAANNCAPRYDFDAGALREGALRRGVRVELKDDDAPAAADVICSQVRAFTDEELTAGRAVIACPEGSVVVTLTRVP